MLRTRDAWNYTQSGVAAISHARSLLDMDTGGGEFLAALPQRPLWTHATEGYGPDGSLAVAVRELEAANFRIIEQHEAFPITRFYDVGAIVYYLKAVSWEIPDFSVDRYFDKLVEIHTIIQSDGYVDVPFHQFFIRAQRVHHIRYHDKERVSDGKAG